LLIVKKSEEIDRSAGEEKQQGIEKDEFADS